MPEQERLEASSSGFRTRDGRQARGRGRKAAAFLIEEFQRLKLEPLFNGQFVQEIPGRRAGPDPGAERRGDPPRPRPQAARRMGDRRGPYDHLGVRGGVLYPGADDNASGVAMMLEVARSMAAAPGPRPAA